MPISLHLIHRKRKEREAGTTNKPKKTLDEERRAIVLPYTADHIDLKELQKAIDQLNAN